MEAIGNLKLEMKSRGIFAYIVTSEDFHGSEYVGEHFKVREYLSGFTGSAGTLVVTENEALLWTDGRYFIQAAEQLSGSGIKLMKMREPEVPTIEDYFKDNLPENSVLGFDGRTVSADFALRLRKILKFKNIEFKVDEDLGGIVWKDRPPIINNRVFELPDALCGSSRSEKLSLIREKINGSGAECLVISALDEIAWTLNLRGSDIEYNPVFAAFMIIYKDKAELFADKEKFPEDIIRKLNSDNIELRPYHDIYKAAAEIKSPALLCPKALNFKLFSAVPVSCRKITARGPVELLKAVKNPSEILSEKNAHLKDGIAVTRFMKWLKDSVGTEYITEISAAEKLEEFRRGGESYLGQSFEPIMAYKEHAAIVHYSATEETNAEIKPRGMLLSDTGGHYLDGTTDITRTFVLGELTDEEKRAFTLVLAGHLELLHARFPKGTHGACIDYAAREPLWKAGLNYNHGTGHGVGFLLNVHEGPQRISSSALKDVPFEAGMITSDEPGLYIEGKFGIRHESLILCEKSEFEGFLEFSPLTLVPFDREGVDAEYFTPKQREYFNQYQRMVRETLSPRLSKEEAQWLAEVTREI